MDWHHVTNRGAPFYVGDKMRWIKHLTSSSRDEKLLAIQDEFGLEGYGLYWLVLETIGEKLSKKNEPYIEMSTQNWKKTTGVSAKKFQKFLSFCSKVEVFTVKSDEKTTMVRCDNLLKYRDEYTSRKK